MTFEDKMEIAEDSTASFINVISALNDGPEVETPFFGPMAAFMGVSAFLMECGWTPEELFDTLKKMSVEVSTN